MQEVFENIIEKLEELKQREKNRPDNCDENGYGDGEQIYEDGRTKGRYEQIVGIIKIIKQAAEEHNNGWIPSDKPPKDDNFVLLSFENFSIPMIGRYEADGKGGGTYYLGDCDGEDSCIANDLYVNAWQPLPESYRPCTDEDPKIQTNADHIRSMSDEELAEIILCPYDTAGKPAHIMPCVKDGNIQEMVSPEYCKKCMMDWLQSEAEE